MVTNIPLNGQFRVTCAYGERGKLWKSGIHDGIDLIGSDNIYATCDGVVTVVGWDPKGWGRYISIQPDGEPHRRHLYCHLIDGSQRVKKGDRVTRTTVIGLMGSTGNSTGKHLHYEIRDNNKPINPAEYMGIPNARDSYNARDYAIRSDYSVTVKGLSQTQADALKAKLKALGYEGEMR